MPSFQLLGAILWPVICTQSKEIPPRSIQLGLKPPFRKNPPVPQVKGQLPKPSTEIFPIFTESVFSSYALVFGDNSQVPAAKNDPDTDGWSDQWNGYVRPLQCDIESRPHLGWSILLRLYSYLLTSK